MTSGQAATNKEGVCKGCDTAFLRLGGQYCGLCIRLNKLAEGGQPETAILEASNVRAGLL